MNRFLSTVVFISLAIALTAQNEPSISTSADWKFASSLKKCSPPAGAQLPDAAKGETFFRPGQPWLDNNGVMINAHGGGMLFDGRYIWLPVEWENGLPVLRWMAEWDLGVFRWE